jgi:ATP-dependent Clp protease ATP-binding subunit ClpA
VPTVSPSRTKTIEFPVELTPRAVAILRQAATEARAVGASDFIGVEHIFLAIVKNEGAVSTQVLNKLGVTEQVIQELESVLSSERYHWASNIAVNAEGRFVGYMVQAEDEDMIIVEEHGRAVFEKDDGRTPIPLFTDEEGNRQWGYEGSREDWPGRPRDRRDGQG